MSANVAVSVLKNEWRRRIGWIAGLALTVALGGGVAIGAPRAAWRRVIPIAAVALLTAGAASLATWSVMRSAPTS